MRPPWFEVWTDRAVRTEILPDGQVGVAYAVVIEVEGGAPPYRFGSTVDVPGLEIDDGGRLVGLPVEAGVYSVAVEVLDGNGSASARTFSLTIDAAGAAPVVDSTCVEPLVVVPSRAIASARARFPAAVDETSSSASSPGRSACAGSAPAATRSCRGPAAPT